MSSIKPLADRVLLQVLEQEEKTSSGILLPDTAKEKTQKAKVIEIGSSKDIQVKKGDIVIYDKYSGIQIKEDDKEYLIVKNEEIVAVIK